MQPEMDDLDRALTDDDTLVPSSGFAARVMDGVHDLSDPAPIAFPWRPFAIGVVACLVWAASAIQLLTRLDRTFVRDIAGRFVEADRVPPYAAAAVLATLIVLAVQRTLIRR
jgi:hypothetical protein